MMKKKATLLTLFISGLFFSGYGQEVSSIVPQQQAIGLKPINFSNIDLGNNDGFQGYHLGLAYERLLQPGSHWAWVIPATYVFYNTFPVSDYDKRGCQLYFTPGVKYYLEPNHPWKGWSAGLNALVGGGKYDYSATLRSGNVRQTFYGILGSWIYNAPVGKTTAFNFELGIGLRNMHYVSDYSESLDFPPYDSHRSIDKWYFSGIMNVSIGISKWF